MFLYKQQILHTMLEKYLTITESVWLFSFRGSQLFFQAKKMGIKPSKHMYTSLFQVCSSYMSEDREYALQQAINLLGILRRTGVVIQPVTYKVRCFPVTHDFVCWHIYWYDYNDGICVVDSESEGNRCQHQEQM